MMEKELNRENNGRTMRTHSHKWKEEMKILTRWKDLYHDPQNNPSLM
jgi:hypothetical protein